MVNGTKEIKCKRRCKCVQSESCIDGVRDGSCCSNAEEALVLALAQWGLTRLPMEHGTCGTGRRVMKCLEIVRTMNNECKK